MPFTGYKGPMQGAPVPTSEQPWDDFVRAVQNSQPNLAMVHLVQVVDSMNTRLEAAESMKGCECDCECKTAPSRKTQKGNPKKKSTTKKSEDDSSEK